MLVEGRDAAGRLARSNELRASDPAKRVVALGVPSDGTEFWYFQRVVPYLTAAGARTIQPQLYKTGGLEKVKGFCTEASMKVHELCAGFET